MYVQLAEDFRQNADGHFRFPCGSILKRLGEQQSWVHEVNTLIFQISLNYKIPTYSCINIAHNKTSLYI